jgi:hypothetical protein
VTDIALDLTRPPRPAINHGALRLLTDSDLGYQPGAATFATLAAATLGDAATDRDGFSEVIAPALHGFDADTAAIPSLDSDLGDAGFTPGDLEASQLAPLAADAQTFVDGTDVSVNALAIDTGQDVSPPPPPPPPTGGGGDSSGGNPGPVGGGDTGGGQDGGGYLFDPGWGDPYWYLDMEL